MSRNIEMNYKTDTAYEPLYPQTTCDMVIDLLNTDTKSLMGLPTTATGDDAFRELFLAITLDGRALINFTVTGDDGTPCKGVQIESSAFCDSNGNLTPTVETNDEGKVSVFCNNTSVAVSVKNYFDLEDWSHTYTVAFGEQYEETITLTRRNFLKLTSSSNMQFSSAVVRVDATVVGGGGRGGYGRYSIDDTSRESADSGGGGAGGECVVQENISFQSNYIYSVTIGGSGGKSTIANVSANGGADASRDEGATGNGNGANGVSIDDQNDEIPGLNGTVGKVAGYSSFTETIIYGGGGGSGAVGRIETPGQGGGYGGAGGYYTNSGSYKNGVRGTNGFGGGGGGGAAWIWRGEGGNGTGGAGGSGCVALRMYTQSTLPT